MFGMIRPCRHRLGDDMFEAWRAHLCGLCLALRDEHGHLARVVTNLDALVVSALVEAQDRSAPRRTAGPCALRGFRTASVATGPGAQLAAAVSLTLAAAKARDHVEDADTPRVLAPSARQMAQRWSRQGRISGAAIGFDTDLLTDALRAQRAVESAAKRGDALTTVTAPTELATGLAVAHTAVLTGRPGNAEPLAVVGRSIGRIAHVLDAVEDRDADARRGAWNPLAATATTVPAARGLCDAAVADVADALRHTEFDDSALVHRLLVHELRTAVNWVFEPSCTHGGHPGPYGPGPQPPFGPGQQPPYGPAPRPPHAPAEQPPHGPNQQPPFGPGQQSPYDPSQPPFDFDRPDQPYQQQPPTRRGGGCLSWLGDCCTCRMCCARNRHRRRSRDGSDCGDCCDCCNCCDC